MSGGQPYRNCDLCVLAFTLAVYSTKPAHATNRRTMDSEGILDPDAQRTSDSESITRKGDAPVLADRTSKLVTKDGDFVQPMMSLWFKLLDNQVRKLWI